ncbi:glycosyltransferase family 2 protein [Chloroflexi bacterium TSY]|nr:glycosyltransferase family 2 protein [Chloroflexi bacterium TSY]
MSNHKPLVSGIIIFLNAKKYLAEAIESVLAQTYDNWELFLVDDGSTDGSTAIAQDYARQHSHKVFYLEHENHQNRGKNASRNLGVAQAQGKYIALLDGDDVWLPDKLAEQVAILEQMPEAGMLYGRTQLWVSWTGDVEKLEQDSFSDLGVAPDTLVQPPRLLMLLLEGITQTPTTCNAILRKSVFDEIGGFDEDYHDIFEDQIFFAKVELAYPVFVADNVWAKYRQHPESSFAQYSEARIKDRIIRYSTRLKFLKWLERYLQEQNIKQDAVWTDLQARLKSPRRILRLLQIPILGNLVNLWLDNLGLLPQIILIIGRRTLPASVRDWLWVKFGKRLYT